MCNKKTYNGLLIGIPSLSRPQAILKKTLSIVKDAGIDFRIFVEPQEYFLYRYYCGKDNVVKLQEAHKGIGYSRQSMLEYVKKHGYKYLLELDDDIDDFVRIDCEDKKEAFLRTVTDLYQAMEKYEMLGGIRCSVYRFWLYTKKELYKWSHYNQLLLNPMFLRVSAFKDTDSIADIPHFEDTILSLFIMRNGYYTLNYGLTGVKFGFNQGSGGCNSGNRKELCQDAIKVIKKEFPETLVKPNSTWDVDVDVSYYLDKYGKTTLKCKTDEELEEAIRLLHK